MGTTRMTKNAERYERIAAHGRQLLAIFPNATERDPVALCKRLRKLEGQAAAIALRLCNGPEYENPDVPDTLLDKIKDKVNDLLGNNGEEWGARREPPVPVFINRDPRGYALKIDDAWMREHRVALHQDWGGYGIIAPEIE